MALDKCFGSLPSPLAATMHIYSHEDGRGAIVFDWAEKHVGFGSVTLQHDAQGEWTIDTELMGPAFVKKVFRTVLKEAREEQ